jgi:hypothetical protein
MDDDNGVELSAREREQLELDHAKAVDRRDSADEIWPYVLRAAAIAQDCKDALIKHGFTEEQALKLIAPLMQYLKE